MSVFLWAVSILGLMLIAQPSATLASDTIHVHGAMVEHSSGFLPSPIRCGPDGVKALTAYTGGDTLGGSFEILVSYCMVETERPGTWRHFDLRGGGIYLMTGEQWTFRGDDWLAVGNPSTCVEASEGPARFVHGAYTRAHAGGRMKARYQYVRHASICDDMEETLPVMIWFEGMFTPNASGGGEGD